MIRRLVSFAAVASLLAVALPLSAHATTTAAKSTEHHSSTHHSSKASTPKIDINSAPESQLTSLPGIDEATAQKIVSMRPFKKSDQLVSKGIVTKEQFTKISHQIVAHQPKMEKSEAKTAEKPATKEAPKAAGSTEGTTTK